jgi:hypothetical protein
MEERDEFGCGLLIVQLPERCGGAGANNTNKRKSLISFSPRFIRVVEALRLISGKIVEEIDEFGHCLFADTRLVFQWFCVFGAPVKNGARRSHRRPVRLVMELGRGASANAFLLPDRFNREG